MNHSQKPLSIDHLTRLTSLTPVSTGLEADYPLAPRRPDLRRQRSERPA
jgi:hypothetical protein